MRVIASANQKGGCGKTTTAINVASSLAWKGHKVLLIDFDPQAHATMGLNFQPTELELSMYDVMKTNRNGRPIRIEDIIFPVRDNFDLAPANATLSASEQELSGMEGRENRLLRAIEPIRSHYQFIIIDCPPSIGHLCFNALRACKEVIIPIDLSLFSLRGVSKLQEIVLSLKEKIGHSIKSRALITMYDNRTRYSRHVLEKVKEKFGTNVFKTVIRYNIRLRETVDYGLPIGEYDKHSIGHKDYEELAEEVIQSVPESRDHTFEGHTKAPDNLQKFPQPFAMNIQSHTMVSHEGRFPPPIHGSSLFHSMVEPHSRSSESILTMGRKIPDYEKP